MVKAQTDATLTMMTNFVYLSRICNKDSCVHCCSYFSHGHLENFLKQRGGHEHPDDGRIYKIYASLNKLIYTIDIGSNDDENGANPQLQL